MRLEEWLRRLPSSRDSLSITRSRDGVGHELEAEATEPRYD